jgi:protein TonB
MIMKQILVTCVTFLALAIAISAQQIPSSINNGSALPLVQVVHIVGDQYVGFSESCLLLYADGRYHRETRRQEHADGRPSGDWRLPDVFEGGIRAGDLQRLKEIVESENFRAVTGTIGDPRPLGSSLLFGPRGVTPHADVNIFEASVAHLNGSQVFEVFGGTGRRQPGNFLKLFVEWVNEVEKRRDGRLNQALANDCATSSSMRTGSSWEPTTRLAAKPIYTPDPEYPADEQNAGHPGKILIQAIVNADGSVGQVSVKRGINPMLDRGALEAVRKWKFVPARLNGVAIALPVNLEVQFH